MTDPAPAGDRLEVRDLTKDFGGLRAVDGVSFTLERGEILGLIGPNGSGKTTTINLITGLLSITGGSVKASGQEMAGWPPYRIARAGLARTFQVVKLFKDFSVAENVEVAAMSARKLGRAEARERAEAALALVGITHLADLPASILPQGEERRVEIARALATEPTFLLLDEPGAGLNDAETEILLDTLQRIREQRGCGILIVDHDMRLIMGLCDRIHVLNYGRTIAEGLPEQIRREPAVIEAYLGAEEETHALLLVDDLHVRYGAIVALRGMSLTVDEGEIVGLIGVNGAGKSTTMNAIMQVVRPERGRIEYSGASLIGLAPEAIVRRGVAPVMEGRRIFPALTVEENLKLGAAIRSDREAIRADIERWCAFFPILGERLPKPAGTLSGGQQQMLAVARALMSRPKMLLMDEPSLGLSPKLVADVFTLIAELRGLGMTILLVEQNVRKTLDIVDRAYLVNTGRVEFAGTPDEIRQQADLEQAYLGGRRKAEGGRNDGLLASPLPPPASERASVRG